MYLMKLFDSIFLKAWTKRGALPVKDRIEIWGTEDCHFCHLAEKLAKEKGHEVESIEASHDMLEFNRLFPNCKTVPQIIVGGVHIGGYKSLKAYFENGARVV